MEKYYLVKSITRATEQNKNFFGSVETHIRGKDCYTLYAEGTPDRWHDIDLMTPYFVRQYGYKRECDARRSYAYKHPERSQWWQERVEIITVEIHNDFGKEYLV